MPIRPKVVLSKVTHNPKIKHHLRWALIHAALVLFFADLLAAFWPAFHEVWESNAHVGIAVAAFLATLAEYIHEGSEPKE